MFARQHPPTGGCVAAYEAIQRLLHPEHLSHPGVRALAGVIGFAGNELTARAPQRWLAPRATSR
jgi:Co/Zn/Cd efflux system component